MLQLTQEESELLSQENKFLKQTILNLRIEMDKLVHEQGSFLQNQTVEFSNQTKELKRIINAQRVEIEKSNSRMDQEVQNATSVIHSENNMLQGSS